MKINYLLFAVAIFLLSACTKPQPGQLEVEGEIIQGIVTDNLSKIAY